MSTTATTSSPRIPALDPASAQGQVKDLFAAVKSQLGVVPNLMRTIAASPAALEAYLGLNGAVAKGSLTGQQREQISLAVAQENHCDYCLAAHTLLGYKSGLTPEQVIATRKGDTAKTGDAKQAGIVSLAKAVNTKRGQISDAEFAAAKTAGLTDGDIAEVVVNVALNVLTNYFNNAARTTVDFPAVPATV